MLVSLPQIPVNMDQGFNEARLPITPFELVSLGRTLDISSFFGLEEAPVSDLHRLIEFRQTEFKDVLTQEAPNAFRITVARGGEASLKVLRGIPDQEFLVTQRQITVQIPVDAFVHSQESAVVSLRARMVDGTALPSWLEFDPSTGKFQGLVPSSAPNELEVVVEATDQNGLRAETIFRIKIGVPGRAGLTEQIRAAAERTGDGEALRVFLASKPQPAEPRTQR